MFAEEIYSRNLKRELGFNIFLISCFNIKWFTIPDYLVLGKMSPYILEMHLLMYISVIEDIG